MGLKYKTLKEFKKDYPKECDSLRHKNLLIKLCEDMGWEIPKPNKTTKPNGYWTFERCMEEARKYKNRTEWYKNGGGSYSAAKENGWFDECIAHMFTLSKPAVYWQIKENCLKEARKYNNRGEWQKNSCSSYNSARKNGWYGECTAHMVNTKPNGYWQIKENVINEAKKHTSPKKWGDKSGSSYNSARKNGWYEECIANMVDLPKIKGYWTKERCMEEARKWKTRTEWCKNGGGSYGAAKENGWFEECAEHMEYLIRPSGTWTKELLLVEARKWKTKTEWAKHGEGYSYSRALKLNYFEECTAHMVEISKPSGYWQIKENCIEEAKKYKTRGEWQENSNGSKKAANKNGWYEECIKHMKKNGKKI